MYQKKEFMTEDRSLIFDLIRQYPFAQVLSVSGGEIQSTFLPFNLREKEGPAGMVYAHIAKANPQARVLKNAGRCKVIFQGPNSYISPKWYPAEAEDHLPTWNYALVEIDGTIETFEDPKMLMEQIGWLVKENDPGFHLQASNDEKHELLPQIMLFRVSMDRIRARFKLSQNRELDDGLGAIKHLENSGDSQKRELAQWMRRVLIPG